MLGAIFLLIVGLLVLAYSANYLITSAIKIAKTLKISQMLIGLTIVAAGTSAPELAVSAISALNGQGNLSVGNVIGSNIFNLGFILGLSAMVAPIIIQKKMVYRDGIFLLGIILLVLFFMFDQYVGLWEGMTLIGLLIGYNVYLFIKKEVIEEEQEEQHEITIIPFLIIFIFSIIGLFIHPDEKTANFFIEYTMKNTGLIYIGIIILFFIICYILKDIPKIFSKTKYQAMSFTILMFVVSLGLLVISSELIVKSAVFIALQFGISEWAIGATIVAAGTSLPEIATTVAAIAKRRYDLGVGNVIGSDIFNILGIIGVSAIIAPLTLTPTCLFGVSCEGGFLISFLRDNIFSVGVLFITLIITLIFMRTGWKLSKWEGLFLFSFALLRMFFEIKPDMFQF